SPAPGGPSEPSPTSAPVCRTPVSLSSSRAPAWPGAARPRPPRPRRLPSPRGHPAVTVPGRPGDAPTEPAEPLAVLLEGADADLASGDGLDALHRRRETLHGRHARYAPQDGRGADLVTVEPRPGVAGAAEGRVDDEVDLAVQDALHDRGLAGRARSLAVLAHDLGTHAVAAQDLGGPLRGKNLKAQVSEALDGEHHVPLVPVRHGHEGAALGRQRAVGGLLRLGEGGAEHLVDAHDLARRAHLGAEHGVDALAALVAEPVE